MTHSRAQRLRIDISSTIISIRMPEYMKNTSEKTYAMSVEELSNFSSCGE